MTDSPAEVLVNLRKIVVELYDEGFKDPLCTFDAAVDKYRKQAHIPKCNFPTCDKTAVMHVKTGDGVEHHYCSVEHANDHRNVLIMRMMR